MDAPHPRLAGSLNRVATALCLAVALVAGAGAAAQAQTVTDQTTAADQTAPAVVAQATAAPAGQPNPQGTPNPPTSPAGGGQPSVPARPVAAPAAFSHLPIIDFVVTFTQPAVYNSNPAVPGAAGVNQIPFYDPMDLGGTVRFPISRKFSLLFDRITEGTINQPLERQLLPAPNYPRVTRDVILQYHGTWAFNRFLTLDAGESFRHRIYSFGAAANGTQLTNISAQPFPYTLNSTEHHFAYAGLSYVTKPWKEFLNSVFVFSETLDAQNVDHNVAVLCSAANKALGARCGAAAANQIGYLDERPGTTRFYETTQGITWLWPIDPKHGTTFSFNERWGYLNFYENTPYPWRWTSAPTETLSKRFSPGFTLALRHSDFHEALISAPFPGNGFVHVGSWDVIGTFHLDTNSFFH